MCNKGKTNDKTKSIYRDKIEVYLLDEHDKYVKMEIQNRGDSSLVFIFLLRRKLLERKIKTKNSFINSFYPGTLFLIKKKKKSDVKMTEI